MKWKEKPKTFILERVPAFIMLVLLAALLLSIILGLFSGIWKSEPIQRNFFPKDYWEKKISELELRIKFYEEMLQNAEIDLEKRQMIEQRTQLSKVLEGSATAKEMEAEMQQLKDEVQMWRKGIDEDRKLLGRARRELSKYR